MIFTNFDIEKDFIMLALFQYEVNKFGGLNEIIFKKSV